LDDEELSEDFFDDEKNRESVFDIGKI